MAHIILTGATGLAGAAILSALQSSSAVSRVTVLSRRPVAAANDPKVQVLIHSDYSSYPPNILDQLKDARAIIWAQGKSALGMSESEYTTLTHDWPVAAAKALSSIPRNPEDGKMNFVYISGEGANTDGKGQLFARVKGKAETDLIAVAKDNASTLSTYNLRPAGIDGSESASKPDRPKSMLEMSVGFLYPAIKRFAPKWHTPVDSLADVSVKIAVGDGKPIPAGEGVEADGWTLRNTAIRRLAGLQ